MAKQCKTADFVFRQRFLYWSGCLSKIWYLVQSYVCSQILISQRKQPGFKSKKKNSGWKRIHLTRTHKPDNPDSCVVQSLQSLCRSFFHSQSFTLCVESVYHFFFFMWIFLNCSILRVLRPFYYGWLAIVWGSQCLCLLWVRMEKVRMEKRIRDYSIETFTQSVTDFLSWWICKTPSS